MFKFVNADQNGSTPKRQQSQRACSPCRKKKKRCYHSESHAQSSGGSPPNSPNSNSTISQQQISSPNSKSQKSVVTSAPSGSQTQRLPSLTNILSPDAGLAAANPQVEKPPAATVNHVRNESLGARFIGDLNPESIFLAASSPDATRGVSMEDSVGVWLRSTLNKRLVNGGNAVEASPSNLFSGSTSLIQEALLPLLEEECLGMLPPTQHIQALTTIYFDTMHPIFPVIDTEELQIDPPTHCSVLIQQAICLAASKSFAATKHLFLPGSDVLLGQIDFGDRISRAMRLIIELGLVTDKIVLVQALALMSQFFDSSDRGDLASQFCAKAIHHAHSIGLHHSSNLNEARGKYGTTLLCCIWAIDRMNGTFNGRPVLMHDRDVRPDMHNSFDEQAPTFRLFLQVVMLLDRVMMLYRPSAPSDMELQQPYPSFEELVLRSGTESIGTKSLATIEILYHAVTILSNRSKTLTDIRYSTAAYVRQTLSTIILTNSCCLEIKDVVLFPFVVYALSLALSVAYREMRYGKLPLHRGRARKHFQILSDALTQLKERYRTAAYIAEMGNKLLKEMERVVSNVSGTKTPAQSQPANPAPVISTTVPGIGTGTFTNELNPTSDATQPLVPQPELFDPTLFDINTDLDVFGMFDPGFNLDNFDAYLESTLNPSFPTNF